MEEIIYHDKDGKEYVLDEVGNRRPPMRTQKLVSDHSDSGGWREYDSSQGHCGLCGSLTCRGWCVQGGS